MRYDLIHDAIWLIFLGYWVAYADGNKKTVHRYSPARRFVVFIVLVVVGTALYNAKGWWQTQVVPHNDPVEILGVIAVAAGVAIAIWARRILGTNWSANPTIKEGHELITSGPYRYVRHPIYTGILLALFGSLVLANGQIKALIMFAILAIGLHFKSRVEEALMVKTFPNTYPEYRRRTKAIIPFVL